MSHRAKDIRVRGEVDRVFYTSHNFSAGRLITRDGECIQFAGNVVAAEREPVVFSGRFVSHPRYGRQFEVKGMELDRDLDTQGLINYLANNPELKGIGPAKAEIIAKEFGDDFERNLLENAEQIAEVAHVPVSVIERLRDHWLSTSSINTAMTALSAYGLTYHQVTKLVKKLGNNAVGIIRSNPYLLMKEVDGFGFKRVDKIARQVGVPKENPERIRAGIIHITESALEQGDCWVEYEELLSRANRLLVMDTLDSRERIEEHLDSLIDEKVLTCYAADSRFLVALPHIREKEEQLAEVFALGANPGPFSDAMEALPQDMLLVEPDLNPKQLQAATNALKHSMSLISGGAGSGKTFTISAITRFCDRHKLSVVLAAPTGKAAKRMEEATGREASTIHRLLGFNGEKYSRDLENPIAADVLIVDEFSMVDVLLAWQMFQSVDLSRTAVVLVGDHNQLPPVGPGNILRDLIESKVLPTTILDDVVRQAGTLKDNCIAILRGNVAKTLQREHPEFGVWFVADQHTEAERVQMFLLGLFEHTLQEKLGLDVLKDVQVLTPTHKGPLGTMELNIKLQRLIQKKLWNYDVPDVQQGKRPRLYPHDKVIQTRNNYDLNIMNGATGIVESVQPDGTLVIAFDDRTVAIDGGSPARKDIQPAYALTIHKSQGSEFPCSIVVAHKSHSFMHHRNLLYTGVTRARKSAIILGDRWGIANCAKRVQVDERKTFLSLMLPSRAYSLAGGEA